MGVLRCAALALVAPVFVLPAALAHADSGRSTAPAQRSQQHGSDVVVRRAGSALRSAGTDGRIQSRSAAVRAPAAVHLLAARLYWGNAKPAYPTAGGSDRELSATAAYFERISRGRETFDYTVTRWVHVRASAEVMCDTQRGSVRAATSALIRAGYHPQHFNRLMLVTEQCNAAASMAQLPGQVVWLRFRNPGLPTLAHELGHNLGLGHAYGLVCRQDHRRVALGGRCRSVEYGDDWDAMGHSKASYSVPILARLGWAGRIATARSSGTYNLADVEHSGQALQGLRIPVGGGTAYWVEYQPRHSTQFGRSIPGLMIRKELPSGRVEIIDASPGNPSGIAFPDRDLTNPALPVGSSLTVAGDIRITNVGAGRRAATVQISYGQAASTPDMPQVLYAAKLKGGRFRVHWQAPPDNGQIVLGYRVTDNSTGVVTYVRSPGAFRTTLVLPSRGAGVTPSYSVAAENQLGWSPTSDPLAAQAYGPRVTVLSPSAGSHVAARFDLAVAARPDPETHSTPVRAWAEVDRGSASCTSVDGSGPYTLTCGGVPAGARTIVVHVLNSNGVTTDVKVHLHVRK